MITTKITKPETLSGFTSKSLVSGDVYKNILTGEILQMSVKEAPAGYYKVNPLTEQIFSSNSISYKDTKVSIPTIKSETIRYENLGYTPSESKKLASESISKGGVSFTPEGAREILTSSVKEKETFKEKVSETWGGFKILMGREGTKEQELWREKKKEELVKQFKSGELKGKDFFSIGIKTTSEQFEEFPGYKRATKLTGLGIGLLPGGQVAGGLIMSMPSGIEIASQPEEFSLGKIREESKQLKMEEEEYLEAVKGLEKWEGLTEGNEFIGTELQFKDYEKDFLKYEKERKEYETLRKDLSKKKVTLTEFGLSLGTGALGGAVFGFGGRAIKGGLGYVGKGVTKVSPFVGKVFTTTGTLGERAVGTYFTSTLFESGYDITRDIKGGRGQVAFLKGTEVGGAVLGFGTGRYAYEKGGEFGLDIFRTKGKIKVELAEPLTKPFYRGKEKVFMRRYEGFKLLKPETYKTSFTNILGKTSYKKGQFVKRQYQLIPFEVLASTKGKKTFKVYEDVGGKWKIIEKSTELFPYDKLSKQMQWAKEKSFEEGMRLPTTPKEVKGKPSGFTATEKWGAKKFGEGVFEYKRGKLTLPGAYMFASLKGISAYFFRLEKGKGYGESIFGEPIKKPQTYKTFFERVEKGKFEREVKGKVGDKEFKAYIPKEGFKYKEGIAYLPGMKKEVEVVTTFKERKSIREEYFFKFKGRKIPVEEQILVTPKESPKVIKEDKIKPPTIKEPTPTYIPSEYTYPKIKISSGYAPSKDSGIKYYDLSLKPSLRSSSLISSSVSSVLGFPSSKIYKSSKIKPSYKGKFYRVSYPESYFFKKEYLKKPKGKKRITPFPFPQLQYPKSKKKKGISKTKPVMRMPSLVAGALGIYAKRRRRKRNNGKKKKITNNNCKSKKIRFRKS